jgi:hypothetical protein
MDVFAQAAIGFWALRKAIDGFKIPRLGAPLTITLDFQ